MAPHSHLQIGKRHLLRLHEDSVSRVTGADWWANSEPQCGHLRTLYLAIIISPNTDHFDTLKSFNNFIILLCRTPLLIQRVHPKHSYRNRGSWSCYYSSLFSYFHISYNDNSTQKKTSWIMDPKRVHWLIKHIIHSTKSGLVKTTTMVAIIIGIEIPITVLRVISSLILNDPHISQ